MTKKTDYGRLIDADALIDGYKHMGYDPSEHPEESYMEGWCKGFNSAVDHCIHHVIHAPTIEPEQRWIPCSETIDIPDHEVLCCDRCGEEMIGWLSHNDDQWLCESFVSDWEVMYDPIAWREKPEPYREEGEE